MTRRRLLALVCFSAPVVGVAVACGFPDVEYKPDTVSVADTGTDRIEARSDAAADALDSGSMIGDPDGGSVDAAGCRNGCDCDGDHYWRYADSGCDFDATDAAGRLGFGDCDDFNKNYFPGQTLYFLTATGPKGFDYNCDTAETQRSAGSLKCSGNGITGCMPTTGDFTAAPPSCGQTGDFSTCTSNGILACSPSVPSTATQACR